MSPEVADIIAAGFGVLTSLIFAFSPKLKEWWAAQEYQRWITLAFFLLAPFAIYGLTCSGLDYQNVMCPPEAFTSVAFYYNTLKTGLFAFGGSQLAYAGIKQANA